MESGQMKREIRGTYYLLYLVLELSYSVHAREFLQHRAALEVGRCGNG